MKDGGACSLRSCTRVADAMASRACRSAIMIGTPLSHPQMTKVLASGLDRRADGIILDTQKFDNSGKPLGMAFNYLPFS